MVECAGAAVFSVPDSFVVDEVTILAPEADRSPLDGVPAGVFADFEPDFAVVAVFASFGEPEAGDRPALIAGVEEAAAGAGAGFAVVVVEASAGFGSGVTALVPEPGEGLSSGAECVTVVDAPADGFTRAAIS